MLMVLDHQHEYPLQWNVIESIAKKLKVNYEIHRATASFFERELDPQPTEMSNRKVMASIVIARYSGTYC